MALVASFEALPVHGQIEFRDEAPAEYPEWQTGEERAVQTAQGIAVATQGDHAGPVRIEVWTPPIEREPEGVCVLDTEVLVAGKAAVVGNSIGGEWHRVPFDQGTIRVQVFVDPPAEPNIVRFLVEAGSSA